MSRRKARKDSDEEDGTTSNDTHISFCMDTHYDLQPTAAASKGKGKGKKKARNDSDEESDTEEDSFDPDAGKPRAPAKGPGSRKSE